VAQPRSCLASVFAQRQITLFHHEAHKNEMISLCVFGLFRMTSWMKKWLKLHASCLWTAPKMHHPEGRRDSSTARQKFHTFVLRFASSTQPATGA
jgi:hypothetical protein